MDPLQQADAKGQGSAHLANRARVILAGLDITCQQLDHNSLGEVAGGASFSHRWCVVERLHDILAKARYKREHHQAVAAAAAQSRYLLLDALNATSIPLEVIKGFLHQTIQIHLVAELQLWVPFQDYGHHHQ